MQLSALIMRQLGVALCLAIACLYVAPTLAKVSFSGKTIRLIVPFEADGGTDLWARFWAPLIADKLPGKPVIIVENVPGGGSTKGTNLFVEKSTKDGMVLLMSSASVLYAYLLGDQRVKYDYQNFHALLASQTGGVFYTKPDMMLYTNAIQQQDKTLILKMQVQGPVQLGLMQMLSLELLGATFSADFGARGGRSTFETFRSGFYNIDMQTTASYLTNVQKLVEEGKAKPWFSIGVAGPHNKIYRDPTFADLPTLVEIYEQIYGKKPSGKVFNAWHKFFLAGFPAQKFLVLPADTDPEVIEIYNQAIAQASNDKDTWPDTKYEIFGEYKHTFGAAANKMMHKAAFIDPETISWYKNWLSENFGIKI